MGCTSSKDAGDWPALSLLVPPSEQRPIEEQTWEADPAWSRIIADIASRTHDSRDSQVLFDAVEKWLKEQYHDCVLKDRIEPVEASEVCYKDEHDSMKTCNAKKFIILDPGLTDEVIAIVTVFDVPSNGQNVWLKPGDLINSKAMAGAKKNLLSIIADKEPGFDNFDHCELFVIMGADCQRSLWRPSVVEPTALPRTEKMTEAAALELDKLRDSLIEVPVPMAIYLPLALRSVLSQLRDDFAPEVTLWDEGELEFSVDGTVYPHTSRLIVTRDEAVRDQNVKSTDCKVNFPEGLPVTDDRTYVLKRNNDVEKDPGGIVAVSLIIPLAPSSQWPQIEELLRGPVMRAGLKALRKLVKQWYYEGKLQRCTFKVEMGFGSYRNSLIGSNIKPPRVASPLHDMPVLRRPGGSMSAFFVELQKEAQDQLFESEDQFQDVKAMMNERMLSDPDRFKGMAIQMAQQSATHVLKLNYQEAEVDSGGELPITFNGRAADTALVVARHPGRTGKDIIAAVYAVPSPDGELALDPRGKNKTWLRTPEAKSALDNLLNKMQQWQQEDRIAEGECLAQLMIGIDSDTYLYVDGRFEEPSEERMAQFSWG